MTAFNHGAFMRVLRARIGSVPQDLYDALMPAIDAGLEAPPPAVPGSGPAWLAEARQHMGLAEVPGAKHNSVILSWLAGLGAGWIRDDETPWCGTFAAWCIKAAGLEPPRPHFYRALDWAGWGRECGERVGAVAVFGRKGGGHVGFAVGQSASHIYVLGGNQSNAVNIMPIARDRLVAFRWPTGVPMTEQGLPRMTGGTVSRNEA